MSENEVHSHIGVNNVITTHDLIKRVKKSRIKSDWLTAHPIFFVDVSRDPHEDYLNKAKARNFV